MYGLPYIRFCTCPATLVVEDRVPLDPGKSLLSSTCPRPPSGSIREGLGGCFKRSRVVVGGAHPGSGTRCPPRFVPGPRHLAPDLALPSASLAERQGGAVWRWRAVAGGAGGGGWVGAHPGGDTRGPRSCLPRPPCCPGDMLLRSGKLGEHQRGARGGGGGWRHRGRRRRRGGGVADLDGDMALRRVFAPQHPCLAPDDLLPFSSLPQQKASG